LGTGITIPTYERTNFSEEPNYVLEFNPSLTASGWSGLNTNPGNGALRLLTDPLASAPQHFYRLRLSP
jgi:hypothetical protein